jgi:hypothetical protein
MADWKKVVVSGSDISQLNNDAGYLTAASSLAAFQTASYDGTELLADGSNGNLTFASGSGEGLTISANAGTDTLTFGLDSIPNTSLANSTISGKSLGTNLDDLTVDNDTLQLNTGTTYNGSAAKTISIKDGGVDTAALATSIGNLATSQFTGSFTGSFVGDGSGLTGVQAASLANSLVDGNGIVDFTFDGSAGATVTVEADGSTLSVGASGVKVADNGITGTQINTSVAGTGLAGGGGSALSVDLTELTIGAGLDATSATQLDLDLTEVIATDGANRVLTSDGDGTLTAETNFTFDSNTLTVSGDQIITGDLTVSGTASFQNTENLLVADRFVLFASGSSTAGDGGIVVQQGTQNEGELFGYDSGTTRWGVTSSFDAGSSTFTPDAFMATSIIGADAIPTNAPARYQAEGNIFIGTDEGIWIYS